MFGGFMLWAMLVAGEPKIDSCFSLGHDNTAGQLVYDPHWLYRVIRGKDSSKWTAKRPR